MAYTEEEKKEELKRLAEFLNSVEIPAEVLEKGPYAAAVSLLISLPTVEDQADLTEENAAEKLHLATAHLVDLEEPAMVKYLSLYTQVRADAGVLSESELLSLINEINQGVRVGHFYCSRVETGERMVQYRASVMGAAELPLDEGVAASAVLEMGIGYDHMKSVLTESAHSEKREGEKE